MSNTIGMELHEEIVTDLQCKLEQLERENDDLNEEIEDNKEEYKETIEELRNKIIDKFNDKKIRIDGDDRDESYNFGIDVCIDCVEDMFKELLIKLGG